MFVDFELINRKKECILKARGINILKEDSVQWSHISMSHAESIIIGNVNDDCCRGSRG